MLLFGAPLILIHFWSASTLLRGHLALATLSLLVNDPQILEHWGHTLMRFTWTNVTKRGILVLNFGVTCNSLRELHTLDWSRHVSALPENRLWRRHVLKDATQLPRIQKNDVSMINLTMCE